MALIIAELLNDPLILRTVKIIRVDFKTKFQKHLDELFENLLLVNKFLKKPSKENKPTILKNKSENIKHTKSIFKSQDKITNKENIQNEYTNNLKNERLFKKIFEQEIDIKNHKLLAKLPFKLRLEKKFINLALNNKINKEFSKQKITENKISNLIKKNSDKFENTLTVNKEGQVPELRRALSNISAKGRDIDKLKFSLKIPSYNIINS